MHACDYLQLVRAAYPKVCAAFAEIGFNQQPIYDHLDDSLLAVRCAVLQYQQLQCFQLLAIAYRNEAHLGAEWGLYHLHTLWHDVDQALADVVYSLQDKVSLLARYA